MKKKRTMKRKRIINKKKTGSDFEDNRGSITLEAAIVFPLILLIVMILISYVIFLHDRLCIDLTLTHIANYTDIELIETKIESELEKNMITSIQNVDFELINEKIILEYTFPIQFLNFSEFTYDKVYVVSQRMNLRKIMFFELLEDIIDGTTLPEILLKKFKELKKTVIDELKNY